MTRILVTCIQMQDCLEEFADELSELGWQVSSPAISGQQMSENELIQILPDFEGVIAGDDPFTANVLRSATCLRAISKWGIGTDNIDHSMAAALGIKVARTPDVFGDEVADVAYAYVAGLARHLFSVDREMHKQGWPKPQGLSLRGEPASIIGLGNIGMAISRRLAISGMRVRAVDPSPRAATKATEAGIELTDLEDAVSGARFLILSCPLTKDTRGLVDEKLLARLAPGAYLVNVARGPVVKQDDVIARLRSGDLAGAALDVFDVEPLDDRSPLRAIPNVVLGSHNASNARRAVLRASRTAVDNLKEMLV